MLWCDLLRYIPIFLLAVVIILVNPAYAILGLPDNFNSGENTTTTETTPSPQTQSIEGFSTYEDPTSLFTIQYPSDWKIMLEMGGHAGFFSPFDSSGGRHVSTLSIGLVKTNASTLDQLVSEYKFRIEHPSFRLADSKIIDESQTTLSGLPAHKIVTESQMSQLAAAFSQVTILTLKDGKSYAVTYQLGQSDDLPIVQQMINSLQIT